MNYVPSGTAAMESVVLDPFALVRPELQLVERMLHGELQSSAPFVDDLLRYVAELNGKRLRPALLLLTARRVARSCQNITWPPRSWR
jgi:geranylgeranyl pyrophosphate synthase